MAIKQFRAFCAKLDLIASKLVPLFKTQNDVNEIKFYLNTTDKTTALRNLFVFYGFSCHGCGTNYIGKTGRTLYERTLEHAWADGNSTVQTSQGV